MDMSRYREMFINETREHLDKMGRMLVALESSPSDREMAAALFREAHSIKGMAASMGYPQMTALAHHLEDFLDGIRNQGQVHGKVIDRMLTGVDLLAKLLEDITAGRGERDIGDFVAASEVTVGGETESPEKNDAAGEPPPEVPEASAWAETAVLEVAIELDDQAIAPAARALLILRELELNGHLIESRPSQALLARGGPLRSFRAQLQTSRTSQEIEALLSEMPEIRRVECLAGVTENLIPRRRREDLERTVRVRTDLLDRFINLTGELMTGRYHLQTASTQRSWSDLETGLDQLNRLLGDLHHQVLKVRMMPLETITGRLPRILRDLCRPSGKQVRLETSGEEIELDRAILDALADPLVHLLRNAVDHGIPESGTIFLRAWREKDLVFIEMADDGIGMDPESICLRAMERGLISPSQAKELSPPECLLLVCQPGFSTRDTVTETSGRGVGMDIVKAAVEGLGGVLEINSAIDQGTRILLKLPLSVAIIKVLLFELDGQRLALPITRVQRALDVARSDLQSSGKQLVVDCDGALLPLLSLRKILHLPARAHGQSVAVIATELRGRLVGLVVDRLIGQHQAFVKTLAFPLNTIPGLSGATVMGGGDVVFIIEPQTLLEGGRFAAIRPAQEGA